GFRSIRAGDHSADVVVVDLHGGRRLLGLRSSRRPRGQQRETDHRGARVRPRFCHHRRLPPRFGSEIGRHDLPQPELCQGGARERAAAAHPPWSPRAYNRPRVPIEARGRPTMALQTSQERIRPVTGTHIVRVQHEGIVTADAERSKDFYCRVFGWQVLDRPAFKAGGYWIGTPGIFPQIHIIQSDLTPPGPEAPISPQARHTAFEVADMDAME